MCGLVHMIQIGVRLGKSEQQIRPFCIRRELVAQRAQSTLRYYSPGLPGLASLDGSVDQDKPFSEKPHEYENKEA